MNWFRENRFLGAFLIALGLATLCSLWFWWSAKSSWEEASARFAQTAAELNRLERLAPYPSQENLRKMKAHADDYASAFAKLKDELKLRVPPATPLAPNELQSRLRLAMTSVSEKARANKVKLPEKFYLGFDEFAAALPTEEAAPFLGQELAQVEWILNTLIDARVEALTSFRRVAASAEKAASPLPSPASAAVAKPGAALPAASAQLERNIVETTFLSTPAAARRALNQIAGTNQQFFVIRLLHVRNEKDKGPPRENASDAASAAVTPVPAGSPGGKPPAGAALNFIVGNERIETSARVEIVRFTF